jgi:phosphoglycerate dehydrogenase-like enzyme
MGGGPAKDTLLCLLPIPEPAGLLEALQKKFPHLDTIYKQVSSDRTSSNNTAETVAEISAPILHSVTILITLFAFPLPERCPRLSLVHLISAGSNQIQSHPLYTDTKIPITTSNGAFGPQIAEWVMMTSLAISHNLPLLQTLQKSHSWGSPDPSLRRDYQRVRSWVGRRVGILGYGNIGRQVGNVVKAMGAHVVAYTATAKDSDEARRDGSFTVPGTGDPLGRNPVEWYSGLGKRELHGFLKQDLDWLVVAVPLTRETRRFVDAEAFAVLTQGGKREVFVSNVARGAVIDQEAMVGALKKGWLAGAALDVTDPEPLPEESELWDLKNVIVTPHVSGFDEACLGRSFEILGINLERREKGERLMNIVQRSRGY